MNWRLHGGSSRSGRRNSGRLQSSLIPRTGCCRAALCTACSAQHRWMTSSRASQQAGLLPPPVTLVPGQLQQPSAQLLRQAKQLPPKPPTAKQPTALQLGQPQSAGEAATVMPAAAQRVAWQLQQQECAPQPAEGGAPPAQQGVPFAAAAADASPATPAEPDAQQAAASQPDGVSLAELRTLLDCLPVSHPLDGQSSAPRPPPPVPAAGDVLLYCRRQVGFTGRSF